MRGAPVDTVGYGAAVMTDAEYLPFVRRVAKAVASRARLSDADREDLVGAGALALARALTRFDPSRGANFKTFAGYCVKGAMLDHLRSLDPLSRGERQRVKHENLPQPVTLVGLHEAEGVPTPTPDHDRHLLARELLRRVPIREKQAVVGLYWHGRTHREIAPGLHVCTSRISQLQTRAIERMRAVA